MDKLKPEIIKIKSEQDLQTQINEHGLKEYSFVDLFENQTEELMELNSIKLKKKSEELIREYKQNNFGSLAIYPWRKSVLRILPENDFFALLTSRNKYLINEQEQENFQKTNLAVAGLSVGSNIVLAIVMQGGCKNIKIADGDEISTSNMNRIITDLHCVGENKAESLAKKLYDINPYINIETFSDGISIDNINEFTKGVDIIFDEIDSLYLKLDFRFIAKEKKIPLIMITDNGDNVMVDIERYDLDLKLLPFHGLLTPEDISSLQKSHGQLSPQERVALSLKIVQPQNAVKRMQDSLLEVGKTLKTWPQLATASLLAGSVGSNIVKKIANNDPLNNGRLHVSIDSVLRPEYNSEESIKERLLHTEKFLSFLQ